MKIPENIEIIDTTLSTLWLDENGILYSIAKKGVPITKEGLQSVYSIMKNITHGNKVCILTDMTNVTPEDKATRDFAASQMIAFTKALALVAKSYMSRMIANVFLNFNNPPYPVKIFTDEDKAKEWLKQYL